MSSLASSDVGGRGSFQRFARAFARTAAVLSALGLVAAVALSLPSSWLDLGGRGGDDAPSYTTMKPAEPVRLSVGGGLELVTPLVASDVRPAEAVLAPPTDAPLVSWWRGSAKPGAERGQTILTGHAGETGGALAGLAQLRQGDHVDLLTRQGTMRYEVATVRTFDPAQLERSSLTLFKQDGGAGRLVMISGEAWDGTAYQRSVVVTATPLGRPTDAVG